MERSWISGMPLGALVAWGALTVVAAGCKTPCSDARDRIETRYSECGVTVENAGEPTSEECPTADGKYQKCIANCTESASCEALKGEDAAAGEDFGECLADCSR